jgi:hypothetical protein
MLIAANRVENGLRYDRAGFLPLCAGVILFCARLHEKCG